MSSFSPTSVYQVNAAILAASHHKERAPDPSLVSPCNGNMPVFGLHAAKRSGSHAPSHLPEHGRNLMSRAQAWAKWGMKGLDAGYP